ncbi:hypothetical protein WI95_34860 [Burkholderia contaminans]|nr:hypothetical protein WI95_34860 [Burkholderia contaminans]RQT36730.1 hypothetical protein DF036_11445 [Burkholderia contaminans]TCW69808.1 hypothetical protein C5O79_14545 [Burkholderia sp. SRS-25]
MNQGKKPFAHRSAPLKTHNRRKLPGACSTICGAIGRGAARPAGGATLPRRARLPVRPSGGRQRRRALIVEAFPQQAWWN